MKRVIPLTLLVLFQFLNYCVTFPLEVINEDGDSPQIVVPRSPSIDGEQTVYLKYSTGNPLKRLTCLVQGTPTPKVIWIRDNNGIEPPLTVDTEQGIAVLRFPGQVEETKRDVQNISSTTTPKPSSNSSAVATLEDAAGSKILASDDTNSTWDGNYTCIAANFLGRVAKTYIVSFDPSIDAFADDKEPETTTAISDVEEMTTTTDGLVLQLEELAGSNDEHQPRITTTESNTDAPTETTTLKSDTEMQAANVAKQDSVASTTTSASTTGSSTTVSANLTEITSASTSPPVVYVFAKTTSPGSTEYLLGSASSNVGRRLTRYSNRRSTTKNRRLSSR